MQFGAAMGGAGILSAGIWPSVVAAPIIGTVTASILRGFDEERFANALSLALASVTARIGRAGGSPSSRWYLFGEALARGVRAAEAATHGFKADIDLLNTDWLKQLTGRDTVPGFEFTSAHPSIARVGFKPFATARQCANALWAFRSLLDGGLPASAIDKIEIFVPPMNVALIQRPPHAGDRLGTISNAGLQIAIAALKPELLYDTDRAELPMDLLAPLAAKVTVAGDAALEAHLPAHWAGRVVVTAGSTVFEETVIQAPFDAGGLDLMACLDQKWNRLPASLQERQAIRAMASAPSVPEAWPLIERHLVQ
jgi:2-methylcitrate dehydratase PrpD